MTYPNNPYHQYRKTQAETAAPGELVVLLYRGLNKFLGKARTAMAAIVPVSAPPRTSLT